MDRRRVLLSGVLVMSLARFARGQASSPTVAVLMPSTPSATANLIAAFREGLRAQGYRDDLPVLYRYTEGKADQVPKIARELAQADVAVIVTTTDAVVRTVAQQVPQAAIVMVNAADPVGSGLVASLARPGGRVTGLTNLSPEIGGKRVQLLKECMPLLSRLAYLWNERLPGAMPAFEEIREAAARFGLELVPLPVQVPADIESVLGDLRDGSRTALLVQAPNPMLYTQRSLICRLARAQRLPSMFNRVEYVRAGGLLSYGPNIPAMYRRAAVYVDRILKGAPPGELPVEQPSKFELAVSLDTARMLGIAVPASLLGQADTVIG